jgi:regulator of protease activity HflC (stomatin/prohibitin superfamily)
VPVDVSQRTYETSQHPDTSEADYTDYEVSAQTADGQQIGINYTLVFRFLPENVVELLNNVGEMSEVVERSIKANSRSVTRTTAQNFKAAELYSGDGILRYRSSVEQQLESALSASGVELISFLVRKINFTDEYTNAIEDQQIAKEMIETAEYHAAAAEFEKQQAIRMSEAEAAGNVLLAEAAAERQKLAADAEAYEIQVLAEADAERVMIAADAESYSISERGKALERYPGLAQWEFIKGLDGVTWGILDGDGVSALLPVGELIPNE